MEWMPGALSQSTLESCQEGEDSGILKGWSGDQEGRLFGGGFCTLTTEEMTRRVPRGVLGARC
jgi:hypothetical protein